MRVMCILEPNTLVRSGKNDSAMVHVGNEYNVIDIIEHNNDTYYKLEEIDGALFHEKLFAPINGDDETTLVTEEFEEKYCVPVK
jgi:hypothetical protein